MFSPFRHLPALALAVGVGAVAPACAAPLYQSRGVSSQSFERRAYDNGRRDGFARGRDDARSGREFAPVGGTKESGALAPGASTSTRRGGGSRPTGARRLPGSC